MVVNKEQKLRTGLPHGQICTWTGNLHILIPTFSSSGLQSIFSQTQSFKEGHSTFRRAQSSLQLLFILQAAAEITLLYFIYRVTVLLLYSLWKVLFGPLKNYFKNEDTACKIIRYHMARLSGFASSKTASVGVGVSAFESTGAYSLNHNILPDYLFSISDTRETKTITFKYGSGFCTPTSVTDSQNVLPISAEPSLSTSSTILPSDTSPEEITVPGFRRRWVQYRKYWQNIQVPKKSLLFPHWRR
jgi:hypothetical protein